MKIAARVIIAMAIAAASGWATYRYCYQRYVCNLRELRAQQSLTRLFDSNHAGARIAARQAITEMDRCISCWPSNFNLYMVRAGALRMLGRPDEAALDYRRALRIDRRAELYFNLGMTELDAGRTDQAADALTTSVILLYPYINMIPEPMLSRVHAEAIPAYVLIRERRASQELMDQLRARVTREPL